MLLRLSKASDVSSSDQLNRCILLFRANAVDHFKANAVVSVN
jgi:hypothetical protein